MAELDYKTLGYTRVEFVCHSAYCMDDDGATNDDSDDANTCKAVENDDSVIIDQRPSNVHRIRTKAYRWESS